MTVKYRPSVRTLHNRRAMPAPKKAEADPDGDRGPDGRRRRHSREHSPHENAGHDDEPEYQLARPVGLHSLGAALDALSQLQPHPHHSGAHQESVSEG